MTIGLWAHLTAALRSQSTLELRTIAHPILDVILAEDPTGYALWH